MYEEYLQKLASFGIQLNEKVSPELIIKLKNRFDFIFPTDFIAFYELANGYTDYIGFERPHIWDIEKICEENSSYEESYIVFCDSMLSCPWIAYSKLDSKIYKGYGFKQEFSGKCELITDNFTDFLKLIIANSEALY